ncbi:ParB/RepB/Spo0J family partition protein [Streptomyces sp. NBC_01381]|uniref:ParB/RepB/Spo0J family partition protein n=1 Tax=Streptomyces sp. NBC_01381 TaxID=2903845 RepID=UPI002253ECBE|nr:ParB/RepB/Spo0J family partition protein [Streptomyces sp. NBC_01381]MCX4673637.1 ParB/RepB/Spo0J family partition protein [Streptomyces sp. NBC_01381]
MTTPARRKPKRNKGGGKLNEARTEAGVGSPEAPAAGPTGIHALEPEDGELFEHDPADVGPNPMNRRLALRNMDEMIDSVTRQGVHTPGAAMHTKLFMEQYPEWAEQVQHPERTFILGPGHRRHAAALAVGKPMLLILRDKWAKDRTVEENLISENNDRDDLSPIEQALQLDLLRQRGMTGEQIAERSGYGNRGTVSKFLNLLDLPQEIQTELHERRLSLSDGYALSTIRDADKKNDTEAAHELQLRAFGWMRDEGITAEAAKSRLKVQSTVFPAGNTKIEAPGTSEADRDGQRDSDDVSRGKHEGGETEASGQPDGADSEADASSSVIPHQSTGEGDDQEQQGPDAEGTGASSNEGEHQEEQDQLAAAKQSAERRSLACQLLLAQEKYASAPDLSALLVKAVLNPIEWKNAAALAHSWLRELGKGSKAERRPSAYFTKISEGDDANLQRRAAFAIALAANEVHATENAPDWDDRDRAHLNFLITNKAVAYEPTAYEQELLGLVSSEAQ